MSSARYAEQVMERIDHLSGISEEPGCLTRSFGSEAMREANALVAHWMREAGMSVRRDNIGNLIGRYERSGHEPDASAENNDPNAGNLALVPMPNPLAATFVLGSHLDSVRDAGRFDGPLGVLTAISCVQYLRDQNRHLPFAIEVVAFADEEGLRFHSSYLGSKAFSGSFDSRYLELEDASGTTLAEAIRAFGGDPNLIDRDSRAGDNLLGYCEVHIEQGPVLEAQDLPVGVVSAIAGQSRLNVQFHGEAGHAGTVPMHMRHDALCAASEFVLAVEGLARGERGLVATVGQVAAHPGASNVIPSKVAISLDVRHIEDAAHERAVRRLYEHAVQICAIRKLAFSWQVAQTSRSVPCDPDLTEMLDAAVQRNGYSIRHLPSGAGHDAVCMAVVAPVAMLFVRCKGGISHHPDESASIEDVQVAFDVMNSFLRQLANAS